MKKLRETIIVASIVLLVGLAFISASAFSFWQTRNFVLSSNRTSGRVVSVDGPYRHNSFYAVFMFTDSAGLTHTAKSTMLGKFKIGEEFTILYTAQNPGAARIDSDRSLWINPTLGGLLGIVLAGIGASWLLRCRDYYLRSMSSRNPEAQRPVITSTSTETQKYILRIGASGLIFIGLPFLPILIMPYLYLGEPPAAVSMGGVLWIPFGFYFWWRISGRIVERVRYTCPQCNRRKARFERSEDRKFLFLVCPSCDFREKSNEIQFGK